jgi:uncharacterized protein YjbI with pentapeptide repeats
MPAKPDVLVEELEPWTAEVLEPRFEVSDALVTGAWPEARAAGGTVARSRLERVVLTAARLRSLALTDVEASGVDASGADWSGARLRRVTFEGCRLAGLRLAELDAEHVLFRDCRLELATFRAARIRDGVFERCVLDEADFGEAALQAVAFSDCRLVGADFSAARLTRVDLRGSELAPAGDVAGLRGATIDSIQLAGLAPLLARAAGLRVDD